MTQERTNSDQQYPDKMTETDILRLARLVEKELLAGDSDSALRLTESALAQNMPIPLFDLLGQRVAQTTAQTAPGPFLTVLDGVAENETQGTWPFIGSAIYAAFAHTMLPSSMQHARRQIARAATREAADLIGQRVPGQLLVNYFEEGLSQLYDWVSDPSPWVRRALGIAVQFYVQRYPHAQGQIARLLQLSALLYYEQEIEAIQGISQGLETIGQHQPEMLTYWLYEQRESDRQPHELMLHSATTFLSDNARAAFLEAEPNE